MSAKGSLTIVGMPIGNPLDITLRALQKFKKTDLLICEDRKTAAKYFRQWEIPFPADRHILLNEHTDDHELSSLAEMVEKAEDAVLISDSGMPAFCDPGEQLIRILSRKNIRIEVIPGPTALTTALAASGIGGHGFLFAGFPPQESSQRIIFFKEILQEKIPVAFYDTPYRLKKVLEELRMLLPSDKKVFLAYGLTTENETMVHLSARDLKQFSEQQIRKEPPVFIIYDTKHSQNQQRNRSTLRSKGST